MPTQTELDSSHQDSTHRNGSPSLILWLISGLLFIAGTVLSVLSVVLWTENARPGQPVPSNYLRTRCTVLDKGVEEVITVHDDNLRESDFLASVQFRYSANGEEYEMWTHHGGSFKNRAEAEAEIADFVVGEKYLCWYDPKNPKSAVIEENNFGVIVAGVVGLVGLGGLMYCPARSIFARGK